MKKVIIVMLISLNALYAYTQDIYLTGKYSQELGNPFRALLEKKDDTIHIYSKEQNVQLAVKSNLNNTSHSNININHPKSYILKNKTIENILEDYYSEEYNVIHKKSNIEVNVLTGDIFITYFQEENEIKHIEKIEVTLNIEIIENTLKKTKLISMDNTLGIKGDNYNWSLTTADIKNIKFENLNTLIIKIIENEIYSAIRDNK